MFSFFLTCLFPAMVVLPKIEAYLAFPPYIYLTFSKETERSGQRTPSNPSVKAVISTPPIRWNNSVQLAFALVSWHTQKENAFQSRPQSVWLPDLIRPTNGKRRKRVNFVSWMQILFVVSVALHSEMVHNWTFSNFLILLSLVFELMVCWRLSHQQGQNYLYVCFLCSMDKLFSSKRL